jgi:hypothetical protein
MQSKLTKFTAFVTVIFFVSAIFFGCRKLDRQIEPLSQDKSEEKFFTTPENISNELKGVVDDIKKQNDQYHFVSAFAAKNGLPVWSKVVSNVSITNSQIRSLNSGLLTETDPADTLLFFIPLRYTDSSVKTYIACAKFGNQYHYTVYRRGTLTNLYVTDSTVKTFRFAMLSVFGLFEKSINGKDTIFLAGQYQTEVENVSILFNGVPASGKNNSSQSFTEGWRWVTICNGQQTNSSNSTNNNMIEVTHNCYSYEVWDPPSTTTIIGSGEPNSGGGSTGGGTPPPNYNCPPGEWWCESGEYRFINGTLYTSLDYPGKDKGFPWAWWEIANFQGANLPMVFLNLEMLDLNLTQARYLISNPAANQTINDYLIQNSNNQISKFRARVAVNDALAGKPFLLPPVWIDHAANNNLNRIIVNLLQNKCLEQVFNTITKESYTNKLSEMIRDFDVNENVVVYLVEDNTLGSNVYGECYLVEEIQGIEYYKISLNPLSLAGASEEKIANTIFHEFIHGYLKQNITKWDFQNNSSHFEILNKYLDKMAETLAAIFGTNIKDAYCLAFSGLFDDETPLETIMTNFLREKIRNKLLIKYNDPIFTSDESIRNAQNQYLKNGTKGRRTANCQ